MSDRAFRCRLVTPTASLMDEPVAYANLPAWDGLMGVMKGRAPIVVRLGLGELTLTFPDTTHGGGDRIYFVEGGFAQVAGDELLILAENAIPAERITESDAERELKAAEEAKPAADAEDKAAEADRISKARDRARLKARIARHGRGHGI